MSVGLRLVLAAAASLAAPASAVASPAQVLGPPSFLTNDDYPAEARRLHQEGTSEVSLHVNTAGKVTDCRTVTSSGSPSLDAASCAMLSRLRFRPARDESGRPVADDVVRKMKWTLPR